MLDTVVQHAHAYVRGVGFGVRVRFCFGQMGRRKMDPTHSLSSMRPYAQRVAGFGQDSLRECRCVLGKAFRYND